MSDELAAVKGLLEWARAKGFRIGPELHVGSIHMQIVDLRQSKADLDATPMPPTVEQEYGVTEEPAEGTIG